MSSKAKGRERERGKQSSLTHMSLIVQFIVGQLEFVEANNLSHPGVSRSQGIRVYVNPWGHRGVSIASHHPLGAVIHISETQRERREFRDRCLGKKWRPKKQVKNGKRKDKEMTMKK